MLSKSLKQVLGFVHYIAKFTISRFVILRFECKRQINNLCMCTWPIMQVKFFSSQTLILQLVTAHHRQHHVRFFNFALTSKNSNRTLYTRDSQQYKGLGHDDKKITSCERGPNIKSVPDFCSKDYCCTTLEKTTILGSSLPMKLIKKSTRLFLFL